MTPLNSALLEKFLRLAVDTLSGEWLLVGGTLLPAVGLDVRATVDIDLVGLGEREAAQSLELMKLAETLGLPIESVNQTAAFFVHKVGFAKEDLILLRKGKRAKIYRPSVALYWRLKTARLSETDVLDCQHYFNYCVGHKDAVDRKELARIVDRALKEKLSPEKAARLGMLKRVV